MPTQAPLTKCQKRNMRRKRSRERLHEQHTGSSSLTFIDSVMMKNRRIRANVEAVERNNGRNLIDVSGYDYIGAKLWAMNHYAALNRVPATFKKASKELPC